jgi:hypothetical protein
VPQPEREPAKILKMNFNFNNKIVVSAAGSVNLAANWNDHLAAAARRLKAAEHVEEN